MEIFGGIREMYFFVNILRILLFNDVFVIGESWTDKNQIPIKI